MIVLCQVSVPNCQSFSSGTDCSDAFGIRYINLNKLSPAGRMDSGHFSGQLVSQLFEMIVGKVAGLSKYSAEPEFDDDINQVEYTRSDKGTKAYSLTV